jgi:hypothetical protein
VDLWAYNWHIREQPEVLQNYYKYYYFLYCCTYYCTYYYCHYLYIWTYIYIYIYGKRSTAITCIYEHIYTYIYTERDLCRDIHLNKLQRECYKISRGGHNPLHASKPTTHTQNHLNKTNTVLLESLMNHCICFI